MNGPKNAPGIKKTEKKNWQVYRQRPIKIKVSESFVATDACHQKKQHFAIKDRL